MATAVERATVVALLLACALCCLWITTATAELEAKNAERREQLSLLRDLIEDPARVPPGPVAALDGLFVQRVVRLDDGCAPLLAFEPPHGGQP